MLIKLCPHQGSAHHTFDAVGKNILEQLTKTKLYVIVTKVQYNWDVKVKTFETVKISTIKGVRRVKFYMMGVRIVTINYIVMFILLTYVHYLCFDFDTMLVIIPLKRWTSCLILSKPPCWNPNSSADLVSSATILGWLRSLMGTHSFSMSPTSLPTRIGT